MQNGKLYSEEPGENYHQTPETFLIHHLVYGQQIYCNMFQTSANIPPCPLDVKIGQCLIAPWAFVTVHPKEMWTHEKQSG